MFQVNRVDNQLVRLEEKKLADSGVYEREHLQEWLAQMPEALGEELLIIQKEFDGFADTNERLDLLALDKEGQLVIIENKLDDSGRDVVWQALKYVAYCSTLTKAQIVEIYQKYLDRWSAGTSAVTNLCEFFNVEELDDVVLNTGNKQRLVLIAAHFRKEVTATVLWLLGHNVRAQCFRVVPYSFGEELFIDVQLIIPTPEAEDFMIGMVAKDSDEKSAQGAQRRSHTRRQTFWTKALEELRAHKVSRFEHISPSKDHWLSCATGVSGCTYALIFLRHEARVELNLQRPDPAENKWLFDQLEQEKEALEHQFRDKLQWLRLDEKKASRICFSHPFEGLNDDIWPEMIEWLCDHIVRLDEALSEPLSGLNKQLKSASDTLVSEQHALGSAATD